MSNNKKTSLDSTITRLKEELEEFLAPHYEKAIRDIIYTLGNAIGQHAKLPQSEADRVKNSPFLHWFVDHFGFNTFINGYLLGLQIREGKTDEKSKRDITRTLQELNQSLINEATTAFSSTKIAGCFVIAAGKAADFGALVAEHGGKE